MMGALIRLLPRLVSVLPYLAFAAAAFVVWASVERADRLEASLHDARDAIEERDTALKDAEEQAAAAAASAERILSNEREQTRRLRDRLDRVESAEHQCMSQELPAELLD